MDITSILQGIKGKVLDAAHFELLKHAYDLQEQNINQLKSNNDALKESNSLMADKLKKIELGNAALEESLVAAKGEADRLRPRSKDSPALSKVAKSILALFKSHDVTSLYLRQIVASLDSSRIEVESAIEGLSSTNLLDYASVHPELGIKYYLTSEGKRYILARL